MYASFLRILGALHLGIFEQPEKSYLFNNLLELGCNVVKSFIKNLPGTYRIGRETLPLDGGRKRVGVKECEGIIRRLKKFANTAGYPSP